MSISATGKMEELEVHANEIYEEGNANSKIQPLGEGLGPCYHVWKFGNLMKLGIVGAPLIG